MSWSQLSFLNRNILHGCHPLPPSQSLCTTSKACDDSLAVSIQPNAIMDAHRTTLVRVFRQVVRFDLSIRPVVIEYLWGKYRRNCRPNTLINICNCLLPFMQFIELHGKERLEKIGRKDIESYVEYEQDRGLKPITIDGRLKCIYAFLRHQVKAGKIDAQILVREIRIKVPERLPRAMDPLDIKRLLAEIKHVRDRALILVLLRTGMRIGELLNTKTIDVNLGERKILIFEGEKNFKGCVLYR